VPLVPAQIQPLKVAFCDGNKAPYVLRNETGDLTGLDVEYWNMLLENMRRIAGISNVSEGLKKVLNERPSVTVLPKKILLDRLQEQIYDIALCAIEVDLDLSRFVDFSLPYATAGYQGVVLKQDSIIDGMTVLKQAFGPSNAWALFSLLLLVILSILFAHLIWIFERKDNPNINKYYGPGVFDSWWLGIVTAMTVGYGDKVPVTVQGKILTIAWMFAGTYCVGMFGAAVTSTFVNSQNLNYLPPSDKLLQIQTVSDLSGYRLGTSSMIAKNFLEQQQLNSTVWIYANVTELLTAVVNNSIDVAVDEIWTVRWLLQYDTNFKKDNLIQVGDVLEQRPRVMAIGRPGYDVDRIFHLLQVAQSDLMYGTGELNYKQLTEKWLKSTAKAPVSTYIDRFDEALMRWCIIYMIGLGIFMVLWGLFVIWHYWTEIKQSRIRFGLLRSMGLGLKFSQKDLRDGARKLFKEVDSNQDGFVDMDEILVFFRGLGQELSDRDVQIFFYESVENSVADEEDEEELKPRLTAEHFEQIVTKLVIGPKSAVNRSELTAPVMRMHLEQTKLEIFEHMDRLEKKLELLGCDSPKSQEARQIFRRRSKSSKSYAPGMIARASYDALKAEEIASLDSSGDPFKANHTARNGSNVQNAIPGLIPSLES